MTQYDADRLLGYEQDAIDDLRARDEDWRCIAEQEREHGWHEHCAACGECTTVPMPEDGQRIEAYCSTTCAAETAAAEKQLQEQGVTK